MSFKVILTLSRLATLLTVLFLAACADAPSGGGGTVGPATRAGYQGIQDGEYFIKPVEERHLNGGQSRVLVKYAGTEAPGSIVVDTFSRRLYYVLENGQAVRYGVAVGREGLSFRGAGVIGRKEKWPSWQPTANMIRTRPDLYAAYAAGLPGGLDNPLGARALYLYRGGRDTYFRIHGTFQNASIGRATSAGCIRMFNQDAIDLFQRVDLGTRVKVRSQAESLALEGPIMDDAFGRAVPQTAENIALKKRLTPLIADALAERAEKIERDRLAACRRSGVRAQDCPKPARPGA